MDSNNNDEVQANKKVKLNEDVGCAICLESDGILPRHGCKQCTQTAFQICEHCHQSCLSRLCPLCRGEYAPVIFHPYPVPLAIPFIPANFTDAKERFKASMTTAFTLELVGKVNAAVWCPDDQIMHFVLPIERRSLTATEQASDSILASITLSDDQFLDGRFQFTNKIWDLLEQKALDEEGLEDDDGSVDTEGDGPDRERDPDEPLYCTCHRVEYGYMVNCTKPDCPIKWFHFRCVGLSRATSPTSPWFCSNCITKTAQEAETTSENKTDKESSVRIVHEEQKTDDSIQPEGLNEALNIVNEYQQRLSTTEAETSDLLNLSALEFSQATAAEARKWLVSKLFKQSSIFLTEVEEQEVFNLVNDITAAANQIE